MILKIDGLVAQPLELQWDALASLENAAQVPDVSRIDPQRKGDAVRLAAVMALAGVRPGAQYLTLHSSTDDFHASIPLAHIRDTALLIYRLEGKPLPTSAGGPIRFYIPHHAACHTAEIDECANVKFVDRLEFSAGKGFDNRPAEERAHAALHAKDVKG